MPRKYSFFYSLIVGSAAAGGAVVAAFTTAKPSVVRDAPFNSKAPQLIDEEVIAAPILEPEDDDDSPPDDDDEFDPICRVVASSDNKLPPMLASKLSHSSRQLFQQLDLLYTAQSKKELRELSYLQPDSTDSMPFDSKKMDAESRVATKHDDQETKLISTLKRSLDDGGYKLMDKRDLDLCSALNAGYLLRLSLFPDLRNLDCIGEEFYPELYADSSEDSDPMRQLILDGKVLLFRRGYTKEVTTGRLLLPKLDYLQTSLVQRSTGSVTRKLAVFERRLEDFITNVVTQVNDYLQHLNQLLTQKCSDLVYDVLDSVGLSNNTFVENLMPKNDTICFADNTKPNGSGSKSDTSKTTYVRGNKIFKLNRYELGSSFDINDATISPFLLCEMGNETSPVERDIYDAIDAGKIDSASIYKSSAVRLLERISIEDYVDFFSKKGRKKLVTNYFKYSTLLEPSYEEVVVIWRPTKKKLKRITPPKWMYEAAKIFDMEDRMPILKNATSKDADDEIEALEIRAFNDVPMANILAVSPKNKLVFRPADAFVFDFVSVATFLALAGSLKFDSPKLDLLALVSITLFAVRTVSSNIHFFRYSNKYARYDLLVNKFLTSKLSHRGAGALNYLAQEANSQKALRAMCIRDWLRESDGVSTLDEGEVYINDKAFGGTSRVNVDIQAGLDDLREIEQFTSSNELIDDAAARAVIKRVWDKTFED
eukprot:scaffold2239_cov114-Skeletonema_dohrnii-CCMP3373.AAC.9